MSDTKDALRRELGIKPDDFELRTAMITADFLRIRLARAKVELAQKELDLTQALVDAGDRTTYDASWVKRAMPYEVEAMIAQNTVFMLENIIENNDKELTDLTRVEPEEDGNG